MFIIKFLQVVIIFNVLHSMILNLYFKTLYFDVFNAMFTHGPRDNSLCLKQFLLTQLFLSLYQVIKYSFIPRKGQTL